MNESFPVASKLFHAYEVVFEALLNGLIVAVVVMLIAAIVLIILCCWQLKLTIRRKDAELAAGYDEGLKNSGNRAVQRDQERSPDFHLTRCPRLGGAYSPDRINRETKGVCKQMSLFTRAKRSP